MGTGALLAAHTTKIGKPIYGFAAAATATAFVTLFCLIVDGERYDNLEYQDQSDQELEQS